MDERYYGMVIDTVCALAAIIVVLPVLLYLCRQWATRRERLFGYLDTTSLILYYRQFYPVKNPDPDRVAYEFKHDFARSYGRRHYILPLCLLTVLTIVVALAGARTLRVWEDLDYDEYALPTIVMSALAGGFTWVIADLISRLRRRDFTVSDVYNATYRILISVPFGWALAQFAKDNVGVPVAFLLGAFPTGTLFTIARRLAATRLGVSEDPASGALELEKLQSITRTNAERFYDEGISTIVQLAYADPIDITIRTNFDFNYVVDCISQSLLWMYFEDKTRVLASYSLRGAQEVVDLTKALTETDPEKQRHATATLNAVAAALNMSPDTLQTTLGEVAGDPYSQFISSMWH